MKEREIAVKAALEAGKIVMKWFGKKKEYRFKDKDQVVTTADEESQERIVKIISSSFPMHSIVAEENLNKKGSSFKWYIDPIDGTNNFLHNLPYFCVSIALEHHKRVILGVIYNPCSRELFIAEKGKGAMLNGKKIHVSGKSEIARSLLIFDAALHRDTAVKLRHLSSFSSKVYRIRVLGAAALDLVNVALGVADASVTYQINSWDIAAGALIVEEAGGKVTDFNGRQWYPDMGCIVASNGRVHDSILTVLNKT